MPYIKRSTAVAMALAQEADNVGDLTYELTAVVVDYMRRKGISYQAISDSRAALMGTLDEFNVRVARPYEARFTQADRSEALTHVPGRVDPYLSLNDEWSKL